MGERGETNQWEEIETCMRVRVLFFSFDWYAYEKKQYVTSNEQSILCVDGNEFLILYSDCSTSSGHVGSSREDEDGFEIIDIQR